MLQLKHDLYKSSSYPTSRERSKHDHVCCTVWDPAHSLPFGMSTVLTLPEDSVPLAQKHVPPGISEPVTPLLSWRGKIAVGPAFWGLKLTKTI